MRLSIGSMARITRFDERLKYLIYALFEAVKKRHAMVYSSNMDPRPFIDADYEIDLMMKEIRIMSRPSAQ